MWVALNNCQPWVCLGFSLFCKLLFVLFCMLFLVYVFCRAFKIPASAKETANFHVVLMKNNNAETETIEPHV